MTAENILRYFAILITSVKPKQWSNNWKTVIVSKKKIFKE